MIGYLVRRLGYAIITFFGITVVVFVLIHAVPGDPATYYLSQSTRQLSPGLIEEIRARHHLDDPILVQYASWLGRVSTLDFGRSFVDRRPVLERIGEKLPHTIELSLIALLLAALIGAPIGIAAALRPNRLLDRGSGLALILLYSLPNFWIALLLVEFFSVRTGLLPLYGMVSEDHALLSAWGRVGDHLAHLVLPVITLTYGELAVFARFSRSSILEVIHREFIVTARAKGAAEHRVLLVHALRNALIPIITILGMAIPFLFSGSVIVEKIFEWDGIGRLYFESVLARDYPTVMALTMLTATATLLAYLLTDVLYSLADPRIRLGGTRQ